MKGYLLAVAVASTLALAVTAGCGSSSGGSGGTSGSGGTKGTGGTKGSGGTAGGSGGGDVNCSGTIATQSVCYSYSGLPSTLTGSICSADMLKETSSCPTANLSGCCEKIPGGAGTETYTFGQCYYSIPTGSISSLMTVCTTLKGTWSSK